MKSRLTGFIALAMILGPLTGLALHELPDASSAAGAASTTLDLITTGFLRLIKMIVGPLVFCTLTVGVARMEGASSIARVGLKTVGWFFLATFIALIIGLLTERLFAPGAGMVPPQGAAVTATGGLHAKDILEHVIPDSIIGALARNEILQIVVFSLFFGAAAAALGDKAEALIRVIEQAGDVILRMTTYVMRLAPFAVFAALAATVMHQGAGVMAVYARFIGSFYLALIVLWIFLGLMLYLALGKKAAGMIRVLREPLLLAFSTASSEAAYPQTLKSLESFGISNRLASFVLPLGYSFNLEGTALYCSFALPFLAQIYRLNMGIEQQILMLLVLMVLSKGVAGVPRAALMVLASSLSYFGLPENSLMYVVAVDHLMDMGRTATNVVGNAVAAGLVAKWEGEFERKSA